MANAWPVPSFCSVQMIDPTASLLTSCTGPQSAGTWVLWACEILFILGHMALLSPAWMSSWGPPRAHVIATLPSFTSWSLSSTFAQSYLVPRISFTSCAAFPGNVSSNDPLSITSLNCWNWKPLYAGFLMGSGPPGAPASKMKQPTSIEHASVLPAFLPPLPRCSWT